MSAFLRSLRRASDSEVNDLAELASKLESQQRTLGPLVQHADRAIAQLQRLATLGERVAGLERQVAHLEGYAERYTRAEQEVARLTSLSEQVERRIQESDAEVKRAEAQVSALLEALRDAADLRENLGEVTAVTGPFRQLVADMDALRAQVDGFRGLFSRMRDEHDTAMAGYKAAISRLEGFDGESQRLSRALSETGHRLSGLEQLVGDLAPVTESVTHTKRELATAKAIADQLAQKVALLEGQREAIDRATTKLEQLAALSIRADLGLERHAELVRSVTELQGQYHALEGTHAALAERSHELADRLERMAAGQGGAERALGELRTAIEQGNERLALEARSVDGVTKQVAELRRILADTEARLERVAEESSAAAMKAARADALGAQLAELSAGLENVSALAARARAASEQVERLEGSIDNLTQRTLRVEEAGPLLDKTVRDLGTLSATREAIAEALEQLRESREELKRAQGAVDGTEGWLEETTRSLSALRDEVASLDRMRATVDTLRQELDRVTTQTASIEQRRALVDEVQRRLGEVASQSGAIEERSRGLADRLATMEQQLGTIVPRLEEVGRAGSQLVGLTAELRGMEERLAQVQGAISGAEERAKGVEALGERMEELTKEVDQRANAVRRASEHLTRATTLRQEAAEAAEQLAERVRALEEVAEKATERLTEAEGLAKGLDGRVEALAGVQERLVGFEARLAEWRRAEQQVAQALEQAESRQAAITTLQAEIRNLYTMAERTQADARLIVEAEPRVSQTRQELEALLSRLDDGDGLLKTLAERRRQLGRAEERLAQADTLLADVRGVLEVLLAQKAQVDHFLEQASALGVEAKHAEATLAALREERRVSDRVRSALAELKRKDEAATA
jgi:chromosome segregation ATPase